LYRHANCRCCWLCSDTPLKTVIEEAYRRKTGFGTTTVVDMWVKGFYFVFIVFSIDYRSKL
jgi:hypothetical protein